MPRVHRLASALLPALALVATACLDDAVSPDLSHPGPTNDVAPAAALVFRGISAGMFGHTCGVTTGDKAYCWGAEGSDSGYGALGDGHSARVRLRPTAVIGGHSFRQVTAGLGHTCAITPDDRAYCWGLNAEGSLGSGNDLSTTAPVAVVGGLRFQTIEVGSHHTCALTLAGKAYCWGNNAFGQLGDGTDDSRKVPTAVLGGHTFTQISAGWEHTCAVKGNGEAWCWGTNRWGQLGIGNSTLGRKQRPVLVTGGLQFLQISVGGVQKLGTTCAVTTAHQAYCWGDGSRGQRGDGTTGGAVYAPKPVSGTRHFHAISVASDHTCAIDDNDRAFCWGFNFFGYLGDGTTTQRLTPTRVLGGLAFAQVSAGENWSCGTTTAGAGYCWGHNAYGMLGDGTRMDRHVPAAVVGPS